MTRLNHFNPVPLRQVHDRWVRPTPGALCSTFLAGGRGGGGSLSGSCSSLGSAGGLTLESVGGHTEVTVEHRVLGVVDDDMRSCYGAGWPETLNSLAEFAEGSGE